MPAPDIENKSYLDVCKQPIVTAKLPLFSAKREYDARIALQCGWLLQGQILLDSGYREHHKMNESKSPVAYLSRITSDETLECTSLPPGCW